MERELEHKIFWENDYTNKNDMEKEIGALKKAEDAIYIDSTNMTIEEVVNKVIETIKEKM